jgi:hypothetical protein
VWSCALPLPPGTYRFKCLLRRGNGAYEWEAGGDRVLMVRPRGEGGTRGGGGGGGAPGQRGGNPTGGPG